jgi:hydrogenase maturation protein HypF
MGEEIVLRRARGYAPQPILVAGTQPGWLAVGGQQKNTVALSLGGGQVVLSQHLGDLDTVPAQANFARVVADLARLYDVQPAQVACDLHLDYLSTRWAEESGKPLLRVQHHLAHVMSCMAENGVEAPALGVAWDGTGDGGDGTVWGGEFLRVTPTGWERFAHLRRFRLPGGEKAVREPRRVAVGLLYELLGVDLFLRKDLECMQSFPSQEQSLLHTMLGRGVNAPWTSSAGRLFDAVAALLNLRLLAAYEGQAAMALEFAVNADESATYPFDLGTDGVLDWGPMVQAILLDQGKSSTEKIAARFHRTLVEMIVAVARRCGEERVALSGGCFQNRVLLEWTVQRLRAEGFVPYWHRRVPPNDGGLALGQLVAAAPSSQPSLVRVGGHG